MSAEQRPRILILGANGQLGQMLQRVFAGDGVVEALGRDRCDLADLDQVRNAVASFAPQLILNAAAYTAVDKAESEPELAARINAEAPGVLAEEAKKRGALLVHYSTDYVFDGSKRGPWVEDDPTSPLNVYGATKLEGERNILSAGGRALIFRTSWVVSAEGKNFLRTMLKLGAERDELRIVNDQYGAPTSTRAIAQGTKAVLASAGVEGAGEDTEGGVYHMTCAGETSWSGFAQAIFAAAGPSREQGWATVTGIPGSEYPTPARRPANSVLSNEKLAARFGVSLPAWDAEMRGILKTLGVARG
ncbi:dTDP-4-dehydrorhamnose reductase [Silvibacterium dinghuense]|uniref:dTDP-4-dehydrorhamnose reductase n=1 Tax=Silvibacterium dinghuense TaxID=1560006 RepID=A0A4V1NW29_9BACT|nr:dTDP-4-dehydrorhamnose reductase [Silvibacterium dinghuense]RXS97982.1 dTDP-4-dehydrorhamnose reductase [Silvibacterium dinghuense]GGH03557.1 NAD(P)-dependent oxidoreductase [Silvibacterium dinghuense]